MEGIITMNNTTYSAKKSEIESKWYIIDAAGKPLGRVATEAAKLLKGKHKPTYTPTIDTGDHVIVLNCKDAVLTGKKLDQKVYRHHSGFIGGLKETSARVMMENSPEKAMMHAIKGMLPHTKLGRQMIKKLRVYSGSEHENIAQKPEVWEVK
jgi:large subunit ribosomal protein L13